MVTLPAQQSRASARPLRWPRFFVSGVLALLTTIGMTACTPPPASLSVHAAAAAPPSGTFITISGGTVIERSSETGRAIRTLARDATSAAETSNGTMLYTSSTGCSSTITEATRANHVRPVLHLADTIGGLSVSRDGAWIAYLTYDHCPRNQCPGSQCAGAAAYGPNVLVIENTATKRSTRLRTPQGSGIDAVSFSPDGSRFAMWLNDAILSIPTERPSLVSGLRLSPPHGCVFGQPAWTTHGIYAGESCGRGASPAFPTRLALLESDRTSATHGQASIPLPLCIDGLRIVTDPLHDELLTTANTGYGDGGCAGNEVTHIDTLRNGQLHELLRTPTGPTGTEAVA